MYGVRVDRSFPSYKYLFTKIQKEIQFQAKFQKKFETQT